MFGHILENYVAMELVKQLSYKFLQLQLFHYRTISGEEVDFILEATDGSIIGIEVKSSSQFSEKSVKGLSQLKEQFKDKFKIGVVLYQGTQVLPIEPDIYAVPLGYLWS
jgi:predicted AAA+ superfamily ATPase